MPSFTSVNEIDRLGCAMAFLGKIKAVADLVKLELPAAAGMCVVAGEVMALGRLPSATTIILGSLLGFFISAAAMISNDYFDREVDRVNHPERPLPSGRITTGELLIVEACFSLAGLAIAAFLGVVVLVGASALWVIGFLYNWRYKESGLVGNMMVSASVASTFVVGGIASAGPINGLVWTFGALAFTFDLAEEIAGGAMDVIGDAKRNVRSLARVVGKGRALQISVTLYVVVIGGTFIPVVMGWLGAPYLAIAVVTDLALVYFSARLYRSRTPKEGRGEIRHLYLIAVGLVAAFLVGSVL